MHRGEVNAENELSEYVFFKKEYSFTLEKDGVKCSVEKDGTKERFYSYDDVKFYRAFSRKSPADGGREKLYFTAPAPTLAGYNRFRFKADGKNYFTHEFTCEERKRAELAIGEYGIPVVDRKRDAGGIKKLYKTFREDGGLAHRLVAISIFVFVALIIGALIMYLINYFLHTDTDTLALVFAIFCLPFLAVVVIKSQELGSKVKIYDKGVYLKIRSKSGYGGTTSPFAIERAFFTWEEVECVTRVQSQVDYTVRFHLGYCVCSVPDFGGLYEYLSERFPEKCKSEES